MFKAYVNYWKNYVNFTGRTTRPDYWWAYLASAIVGLVFALPTTVVLVMIGFGQAVSDATRASGGLVNVLGILGLLAAFWALANLIPQTSILARRLRDGGFPWWLAIIMGALSLIGLGFSLLVAVREIAARGTLLSAVNAMQLSLLMVVIEALSGIFTIVMIVFCCLPTKNGQPKAQASVNAGMNNLQEVTAIPSEPWSEAGWTSVGGAGSSENADVPSGMSWTTGALSETAMNNGASPQMVQAQKMPEISRTFGVLGIVFGGSAILLCWMPVFGFLLGVAGVVLGIVGFAKNRGRKRQVTLAGFIVGICGVVISLIVGVMMLFLLVDWASNSHNTSFTANTVQSSSQGMDAQSILDNEGDQISSDLQDEEDAFSDVETTNNGVDTITVMITLDDNEGVASTSDLAKAKSSLASEEFDDVISDLEGQGIMNPKIKVTVQNDDGSTWGSWSYSGSGNTA
ncbi:MAG: DUF805 domain-containing protein [Streptococcaceae bacterium]|nr:DUF805 domain-containing protein [Streptococcaceae bacterium]